MAEVRFFRGRINGQRWQLAAVLLASLHRYDNQLYIMTSSIRQLELKRGVEEEGEDNGEPKESKKKVNEGRTREKKTRNKC